MKAVNARITKGLNLGSLVPTSDNSGAKVIRIFGRKGPASVKGRSLSAGIGDLVLASVVKGKPEMRKQTVLAIIVRQKKEFRRADGTRIKFEDNAAVIVKDENGNPKGTMIKGAVAKEAVQRWGNLSKIAKIIA